MKRIHEVASRYSSIVLGCIALLFSQFQLFAYNIGDRVQVINGPIYVRSSAGGTWTGYTQPTGSQGAVLNGPVYSQIGGSGTYYYWYNVNFDTGTDGWVADVGLTSAARPNLNPYLTPGWTDKIIVSRTTGTTTDSTSLTPADTLYVDWSVVNNGSAAAGAFYVYVYVDGTYKGYGSIGSLAANTYVTWNDLSIGSLSAGTHTIQITADATGAIAESNEGDNSYSRSITVSSPSLPNLTPYQPSGWSDKIVVSRATGNNIESTSLTTADTLYIDWSVINNGAAATAVNFNTAVFVDGVGKGSWVTGAPMGVNSLATLLDLNIGQLSAGSHTIQVITDYGTAITESNEGDNSYTKTITVGNPSLPNLTPYQPSGWSDRIVVSRAPGNNIDSTSLTTADTLYIDWAIINNGAAATAVNFNTAVFVDGVGKGSWVTAAPMGVNSVATLIDLNIGQLSAGSHTIQVMTDYGTAITESNEGDNSYTKTITVNAVAAPNLTPYQPSGWSDKIIVSRTTGNNTDSTGLMIGDVLYVDWAVLNNGNAAVGSLFYTELYLDGVLKQTWNTPAPLSANYYANVLDYNIGSLGAGTHTLRIKTDSTGVIGESNESDNEYTKTFSVGSTSLPDFIITSISLSPSVPQPGQAYTAYVTVKNQGAVSGDGKWLDVWANQSASQSCGADGNTWTSVGVLTANQSKTFTFSMTAPATGGSYPFRAFVDSACQTTESNDGNNQNTFTYSVTAPSQVPEFVVTAISVSPSSPAAGQSFTATVTVKNQGAGAGDGGWLDVWANQSSAPSCGTDGNAWASVGTLSAGQIKTYTVALTAPATGGSYTCRAFVDSYCQTTESNDGNNQTTLGYSVGGAASPPDFLVTSVTFNPATPVGGQPFTAYVTVKNQGAGLGNAGWLSVWVNQPSAQSCGANGDQNQSVGTLAAGQSVTKTFNLTTPASGAPWTFRAFADSGCQTTERSSDGNNQTTASYGANPVQSPDFFITGITISPSNLKPGDKFTAYITVKNQGATSADAGWLDVWANKSSAANCGDNGDAYQKVGTLTASQSKTITVANLTAVAGNNTVRAFIDSACQSVESNEGNNQFTYSYAAGQRVLVLLHGMNSDPSTWNDFIQNRFNNSAPIIYGGDKLGNETPVADASGVICYRLDFGYYDSTSGRSGVEGVSTTGDQNGDFSTFSTLGSEVWDAVNYILSTHPSAQVTLLGHSRGGIAARAFLQQAATSPEKSSVVALLTTGTPHKGSRLGRIYSYLADPAHPRTTDSTKYWKDDWDVVDKIQPHLDARRPTINDLADNSSAITTLNGVIANMPAGVSYGAITYTGVNLGRIARNVFLGFDYSIFSSDNQATGIGPQVSTQAEDFMLGAGLDPMSYPGDGIVPLSSQRYDNIAGFPGASFTAFNHGNDVLHTEEPNQEAHLTDALSSLLEWW